MSSIVDMLHQSCLRNAQKTAMRCKVAGRWIDYTYQDVRSRSDQIAAGLAEWGLTPGERAALLAPSSPTWVTVYLGILKSNAIAVPIDKDLKQGELRHVLMDSGARILFTEQNYLEILNDIAEHLPALEKIVLMNHVPASKGVLSPQVEQSLSLLFSEWRRLSKTYQITAEDVKSIENLAEGLHDQIMPEEARSGEDRQSFFNRLLHPSNRNPLHFDMEPLRSFHKASPPPRMLRQPSDPAVILYTSGTTGRSKGAMLSHDNIVSNVQTAIEIFELDANIHTLSFLPINHVFEQVAGIILPLAVGGTISFAESLRKLGENLGEVKPNFLLGVPAVFRLLADRMNSKIASSKLSKALFSFGLTRPLVTRKIREAFGGAPVFISGGAALDPVIANALMNLGLHVYQGYGITETSPVIAVETPKIRRLGTVGKPLPGVEVKIHQPDNEGVGEIWVKGPNVMLGYHNNQEATSEVITDGWYHTGDLGRIDEDGLLSICGRVKNLIVTANGKNVYPEEVENEMLNSNLISEIMVYGHKISKTSEEVYAMVYPDQDALDAYAAASGTGPLEPHEIESLIRREILERGRNLADYKRIKRFTLREDEFPKTTTRKIKRFVVEADIDTEAP